MVSSQGKCKKDADFLMLKMVVIFDAKKQGGLCDERSKNTIR
jgi:hypothetical protein